MFLLLLLACGPQSADDCIPTTGDNCSCAAQCLTEPQLRRAQMGGVCDLGCPEVDWTCALEDGECVVVGGSGDDTAR